MPAMESLARSARTAIVAAGLRHGGANGGRRMDGADASVAALDRILAKMSDPIMCQVGLYWRGKVEDGRLPARSAIDPAEIPALLPYLILWDVERDPLRFRNRICGTHVVEFSGRNVGRQYLESIDKNGSIGAIYRSVSETGLPHYEERFADWPNHEHKYYGRLVLPLTKDGKEVDMLFGAINTLAAPLGQNPA
jgi:hypothetical protein